MKKQLHIIFLVLFSSASLLSNAQNYYNNTYHFGYYNQPTAIVTDSLENIYVCGWFEDENHLNQRAFVFKTDNQGQELWRIIIDTPSKYYALCLTHTGGVALAGSKDNNCFLNLLDSQNGTQRWSHEETETDDFWFGSVNEFYDGESYKLQTVKSKTGIYPIWYYLYNPDNGHYINDVKDINNMYGSFYTSATLSPDKIWTAGISLGGSGLVMYNNFGDGDGALWSFSAPHIAGVDNYTDHQGVVVIASGSVPGDRFINLLVMDLDNHNVFGSDFIAINPGSVITGSGVLGYNKILVTGTIDDELALWFIDHNLVLTKEKIIATEKPREGVDVVGLPSSDMVIMGTEQVNDDGSNDVFLMRLNSNGALFNNENKITHEITLFPNPVRDEIFIKTTTTDLQNTKVLIVNSMGKTVKAIKNINRSVSMDNLPTGLYIAVVYSNNKLLFRQKLIKQ
ncbi:MAG: hypothetical protein DRJ09_05155 [Bacteroidetes bacterium]|nr:MAG: hypothetical protein DRJ09_05155 [Bacteroidota bacterium]